MGRVDKDTIAQLAHLARLEFQDEAMDEIENDLNKMLDFVDKLNELDTARAEPLIYMNDAPAPLREDDVKQVLSKNQALANAPQKDSDYLKAPKVIPSPEKADYPDAE